jgi:hypothetical protein
MAEPIQSRYVGGTAIGPVPPPAVPVVHPDPNEIAELGQLRRREMVTISNCLGRFPKIPWGSIWAGLAAILIGAAAGGAVAALQMAPHTDKSVYWAIVGAVLVVGLLTALAAYTTNAGRSESTAAIKADLDTLLAAYPNADKRTS